MASPNFCAPKTSEPSPTLSILRLIGSPSLPRAALVLLAAHPELMEGREKTRANFFARADLRDPQQKALLESYLLDPRRSAQELQTFAGIFPNANYMISNNLLTPRPRRSCKASVVISTGRRRRAACSALAPSLCLRSRGC